MKKFLKDFGTFITKGNVFDMAVGLIIATAFNKIVSSMVNDLIMPLITWATGASSLADLSVVLKVAEDGTKLTWNYGNFIQVCIDFFIIALSVFFMVKIVMLSRKKFKEISALAIEQSKIEFIREKKAVKSLAKEQKRPFKSVWAEHLAEKQRQAEMQKTKEEEDARLAKLQEAQDNPTSEQLLKEIRDLIKNKQL